MDMPIFACQRTKAETALEIFDSDWTGDYEGGPLLYVEDVFVDECARRRGVGTRLLIRDIECALDSWAMDDRSALRVELSVLAWNEDAIRVYERLGFRNVTRSKGVQFYAIDIRE